MCNANDMIYCNYCKAWYRKDYVHVCSINYYACSACGQYVSGNHNCVGSIKFYPYPKSETKYYKCPKCKGEFNEPFKKFMGKFKNADIKEFGSEVIVGNTKVPIEKYVCPFCGSEMKGLNQ